MIKYTEKDVENALKKHSKRVDVANCLGCSPSHVAKLIDQTHRELRHLAKWREIKTEKNKIWGKY